MKTDAFGQYSFRYPGRFPETVVATAYHDGFGFQPCASWFRRDDFRTEETLDIMLVSTPGLPGVRDQLPDDRRTITGTVYAESGAGPETVADAWVGWELFLDVFPAATRTDARGRFALCGLPADASVNINATAMFSNARANVYPGGDADVKLILGPAR